MCLCLFFLCFVSFLSVCFVIHLFCTVLYILCLFTFICNTFQTQIKTQTQTKTKQTALGTLNQALVVLFGKVEEKAQKISKLHEAYGKIENAEQRKQMELETNRSQTPSQNRNFGNKMNSNPNSSSNSLSPQTDHKQHKNKSKNKHKHNHSKQKHQIHKKHSKHSKNNNNTNETTNDSNDTNDENEDENEDEIDTKKDKNDIKTDDEYVVVNSHQNDSGLDENDSDSDNNSINNNSANETTSDEIIKSILNEMIDKVVNNSNEIESKSKENEEKELKEPQKESIEICESIVNSIVNRSINLHLEKLADIEKKIGNQMYSKNLLKEAIIYYERAHSIFPLSPVYLVNQGVAYYSLKHYERCEKACIDALLIGLSNKQSQLKYKTFIAKAFSILAHVSYQRSNIVECVRYYRLSLRNVFDKKISDKVTQISKQFDIQLQDVCFVYPFCVCVCL